MFFIHRKKHQRNSGKKKKKNLNVLFFFPNCFLFVFFLIFLFMFAGFCYNDLVGLRGCTNNSNKGREREAYTRQQLRGSRLCTLCPNYKPSISSIHLIQNQFKVTLSFDNNH